MKRIPLLLGLCLLPALNLLSATLASKPNILLIVADDLGYADLGCQGSSDVLTPHIDSLAKTGVRLTSGYVSCPVCSPTRAGMLTGRYQQRFGHEFNPGPPAQAQENFGLPLAETTIADQLKKAGYVTGMVGKWHLGLKEPFNPTRRGFDEYFGFLHGSHSYVDAQADPLNFVLRGTTPVDEKEYLTEAFTREAVGFIERHQKEPFFLYLPYNAVHAPMQVLEKYKERFTKIQDDKRRTFAAMLAALDDGVGVVLKKLRDAGLEQNTLIFFISDNGGPTPATTSRNDPLRGFKGQVWEGGIRIPFIVKWPGHLPAGKVYDPPAIALDILPTTVAAAGGKLPEGRSFDGVNLLPYLSGEKAGAPHEFLFWRYGAQSAVRSGDWKLLRMDSESPQLFNLASDIGETKDLAAEKPEIATKLQGAFKQWDSQLEKPRWGGGQGGKKAKKKK